MMPDIQPIHWNVPNPLSYWLDAVRGPTNESGRGTRSNGPRISVKPLDNALLALNNSMAQEKDICLQVHRVSID